MGRGSTRHTTQVTKSQPWSHESHGPNRESSHESHQETRVVTWLQVRSLSQQLYYAAPPIIDLPRQLLRFLAPALRFCISTKNCGANDPQGRLLH
jgi:hypothetical protein